MILENEFLIAEINEDGAELARLYDKKAQRELVWNADAKFWKRHSPVLFPHVGKLFGGFLRARGGVYPHAQHGFARDSVFEAVCCDGNACELVLKANDVTRARYPFEFVLKIGYELEGNTIRVKWHVENADNAPMPFTIGAHPAFNLPTGKKEDYCVEIPAKDSVEYVLLDPASGCAIMDKTYTAQLTDHRLPLSEALFAHDALVLDDTQVEEAWICDNSGKRVVGVISPNFPNYGIWSVKDAPFVCLEPWKGRCDNVGYTGTLEEKPGATVLQPGETFDISYVIAAGE